MKRILLTLALTFGMTSAAYAGPFWMVWPVECNPEMDCVIQSYPDHDPGPGATDFTCSTLTYDGHRGTDIRLMNLAAMRAGVTVMAPADGKVIGVRDGMEDRPIASTGDAAEGEDVAGKECGNGVHIKHHDGNRTQLCHLRNGSITVEVGKKVKAGQPIGMIGMSGKTEFPHLHITVWKDDEVIDPATRQPITEACNANAGVSDAYGLWKTRIAYRNGALLGSGFFNDVPKAEAMRDTPVNLPALAANTPAMTFWVDVMGIRADDALTLRIIGPDGKPFAENTEKFTKPFATYFAYIGKRNTATFPAGKYVATITLMRAGSSMPVIQASRTITVQ